MTITTAKLARAVARAYARPLAVPLAVAALLLAPAARADDWKFVPTLDLRQTYTDNVALQPDDRAESQLVTEITPGFRMRRSGPRLSVNALSSLVLGGVRASTLRAAGMVTADEATVQRLDAVFASAQVPYLSFWY